LIRISLKRITAVFKKELVKMWVDRVSLISILIMPVIQIVLFGYTIEFFPKHLPAAVINYDHGTFANRFLQSIKSTRYFKIESLENISASEARKLLKRGTVNYVLTIPPRFTHDLIRGRHPHILLEADASVVGTLGAIPQAVERLRYTAFENKLKGTLSYLVPKEAPFNVDVHALYNAQLASTFAVIPGVIGMILMISLCFVGGLSIVEEKRDGNIELLLNTSMKPIEILIGKFLGFLVIGYAQLVIVLLLAALLFHVPVKGGVLKLLLASGPYIVANLMLGLAASTISKTPLEASKYVTFFFLPSFLLSGYIFPFYGIPPWAQVIGDSLPITHYIRIASGIMLKGNTWLEILPELWPIVIFSIAATLLALVGFKKILD